MKLIKTIVLLIIAITVCQPLHSENVLPPWLTLNDLTNPSSPSYVPYPFPETRTEIIANLKFYLKRSYAYENQLGNNDQEENDLLFQLTKKNSNVIIEDVVKVTNRIPGYPAGYSYLVIINDTGNNFIARVSMRACGLIIGGTTPSLKNPGFELKSNEKVVKRLAKYNKTASLDTNIKGVERVAYDITFAPPHRPIYEITMADESIYYVDYHNRIYKKTSENKVEGDKISFYKAELRKLRSDKNKVRGEERRFLDSLRNKIVYLERIDGKENN
ncbi:MAG: hypothetical protein GY757_33035 [bacterium]|nr:hypothetical protein [bacterium]